MADAEQKSDENGLTLCQILRVAKLKYVFFFFPFFNPFELVFIRNCSCDSSHLALCLAALWISLKSYLSLLSRLVQF